MGFPMAVACAVVGFVGVTGCASQVVVSAAGSSGSEFVHSPSPTAPIPVPESWVPLASGAYVIVVKNAAFGPAVMTVHDVLDVELQAAAGIAGTPLVLWQTPVSSGTAVLTPDESADVPPCPQWATCTAFTADGPGTAMIQIKGPRNGCDPEPSNCAGIGSVITYSSAVTVFPDNAIPPTPYPSAAPSTNPPTRPSQTSTPQSSMLILATGSPPQVVLTDADNSHAIEVVVGTTIVIELKAPPSPGLLGRWPGKSSNENVLEAVNLGANSTATPHGRTPCGRARPRGSTRVLAGACQLLLHSSTGRGRRHRAAAPA